MPRRDELLSLSAAEVGRAVGAGELDPAEIVQVSLDAIEEASGLNIVLTACPERALKRARRKLAGPLAGVPLLVKDLFDTSGVRTTYGSKIYADHVPGRTAGSVAKLEAAGAVVVGKANLDEFAWGTTSQNPHWGIVRNPTHPGRVAGGSSGGNGAALAGFLSPLGIGTDTGGSVRIPSACCGTVGFKPSWGKVPIDGVLPLAPSFDTVGPMARTVADCALAYSVLSGEPVPGPRLDGMVVGLLEQGPRASPHEPSGSGPEYRDPEIHARADRLEALGARVVETTLPEPAAEIVPIFVHGAAVSHQATFPSRRDEYGPACQLKWEAANKVPSIDVWRAQQALPAWREQAASEPAVDLFLCPTLGCEIPAIDVWEPDVRIQMTAYTRCFNFLGWPALAVAGFQIAGCDDRAVLAAGLAWEEAYGPTVPAPPAAERASS